jgi:hypothetical protein
VKAAGPEHGASTERTTAQEAQTMTRRRTTHLKPGRRDIRPLLAVLMVLTLGVAGALAQPGSHDKKDPPGHAKGHGPKPEEPTDPTPDPAPGGVTTTGGDTTTSGGDTSSGTTTSGTGSTGGTTSTASYPPPATEGTTGIFITKCSYSHRKQVDPIVAPGPPGTLSGHMHEFFGNRSTDSFSTYTSMIAAGTTCVSSSDTAAYWIPMLLDPSGNPVTPKRIFAYYRNRPEKYGTTQPFPPDFRVIAGGEGTFPSRTYWKCHNGEGAYYEPPYCPTTDLKMYFFLPNCWDGVRKDSPDHRSHVVYPNGSGSTACPSSHPVKLPQIQFFVHFPSGIGGPGYRLADGTTLPHMDFWNTWKQPRLEQLVRDCLNKGIDCGQVAT